MNDPNKAISVNLSSLLSLKAELLRKQHEVKMAKATQATVSEFKPKESASKSSRTEKREQEYKEVSRSAEAKVYETEDHAQLDKSRRVLEAKSKFYERMSRSGGSLNSDDNCLVMFNRKKQEDHTAPTLSPRERTLSSSSSSSSSDEDDDGNEVEYVDCLGRTRKCLKRDLAEAKRRDAQLAQSMPERLDQTKANWMLDAPTTKQNESDDEEPSFGPPAPPPESVYSEALSTMTKHDEQRMNWERKEQENVDKPDVHYQDVFFDEARTHGVGYYAFSTDEQERKQQQIELELARKATAEEQKRRDEMRIKRNSLVADRVLAAKNRIRARKGLPVITKEEYEREQQEQQQKETAEAEKKERAERKEKEKLEQQKAAEEAEREELRKEHVRDWDKDKDHKPKLRKNSNDEEEQQEQEWQYKAERLPMSQEQWNEKQRALRQAEFAPPTETEWLPPPKRTNFNSMPPPLAPQQEFSNFHSTRQEKQFQRRNYLASQDREFEQEEETRRTGAAIPPPVGLDDAPPKAKRPKSQAELEQSIEAGLRFLRNNCDKGVLANKATWTAKADY